MFSSRRETSLRMRSAGIGSSSSQVTLAESYGSKPYPDGTRSHSWLMLAGCWFPILTVVLTHPHIAVRCSLGAQMMVRRLTSRNGTLFENSWGWFGKHFCSWLNISGIEITHLKHPVVFVHWPCGEVARWKRSLLQSICQVIGFSERDG